MVVGLDVIAVAVVWMHVIGVTTQQNGDGIAAVRNVDYPNREAARRALVWKTQPNSQAGWSKFADVRGGTVVTDNRVRVDWYNGSGGYLGSEMVGSINIKSRAGRLFAMPAGDFTVDKTFTYFDETGRKILHGTVCSVPMRVSYANSGKPPSGIQCYNCVKVYVESGYGNLIPLKSAAKMRFAASTVDAMYDAEKGRVVMVCLNCLPEKEAKRVKPVWRRGARR